MGRFFYGRGHRQVNLEDFGRKRTLQQYYYGRFDTWSLNGGKQAILFVKKLCDTNYDIYLLTWTMMLLNVF